MAHGRISKAGLRSPNSKRRLSRYANSRLGQRGSSLPPHLLRAVSGRDSKKGGALNAPRIAIILTSAFIAAMALFIVVTAISTALGVVGTMRAYKDVNANLPDAAAVATDTFQTTEIYARDGTLLQEVDNPDYGWRTFMPLDQMAPDFVNATVASEDSTFWTNEGVEPYAILRGGFINISGAGSSGGSTITQQLVRSIYPDQISGLDISYTRKGREALAAYALNRAYSKTDILTMYVNQIYYGARSYGVEAASNTYFNKHASELTLAESSLLAGLPQSPSYYDPTENFEVAKIRQQYVLNQMVKYRYITRDQADDAFNEPLNIRESRTGQVNEAPHFTEYVRQFIIKHYGEEALYGGLKVTTSIDLDLQASAEQIVANGVADMAQYNRNNAAMVIMAPWSGEVLAMVGSADFENALINGEVNYATSLIQPGSSMKPIVYAGAFEKGWNPGTVVMDIPTTWSNPGGEDYKPNNYSKTFYGAVPVRTALANSFNIPAVKATEFVGVQGVMDVASRMGLEDSLGADASVYGLSIGLGAGEVQLVEHTNAYGTLANNGKHVPQHPIIKIEDSQGNVLYDLTREQVDKESSQAVPSGNAYQVTSILTDNKSRSLVFGENNLFGNTQTTLGRQTAAKSGTTENWRDLWTMGYTTDVAIGVWVGNSGSDNPEELVELDGIQAAGPIWQDMMVEIHNNPGFAKLLLGPDGKAMPKDFPVPPDVSQQDICGATGHKPGGGETRKEWIVKGQEPKMECGQLSEAEKSELDKAIAATRTGNVAWAGGAVDRISQYANAANVSGAPAQSNSGGDNQIDPANTTQDPANTTQDPANTNEQPADPGTNDPQTPGSGNPPPDNQSSDPVPGQIIEPAD